MTSVEDPSLSDIHIVRKHNEKREKRPENSDDEARTPRKCTSLSEFLIERNESAILPSKHSPSRRFENSSEELQKAPSFERGMGEVALNPKKFLWVAWVGIQVGEGGLVKRPPTFG